MISKSGLFISAAFILFLTTGCGEYRVSSRYISQDYIDPNMGGGRPIQVVIVDQRQDKELMGITDDIYKQPIRLNKPVTEVVQDGFTMALSEANWQVTEAAALVCQVTLLETRLVWAAGFGEKYEAKVAMNVALVREGETLAIKRITEEGWRDDQYGTSDEVVGGNCFSVVMSRAIQRAVNDKELFTPDKVAMQ